MSKRPLVVLALIIAAGAAAAWVGCGGPKAKPEHPVAIIGFDGLTWDVAGPLIRAGKMPNLQALVERGTAGYLYTAKPAKSPTIWTTIATGKREKYHGVLDFADPHNIPYTSESRKGKALWNIASDYDLKTVTLGWWVTWPAEPVNGIMVAPYSAAGQGTTMWKGNFWKDLDGQTWPVGLFDELWPIAEKTANRDEIDRLARAYFGDVQADPRFGQLSQGERERIEQFIAQSRWAISADETYLRMAQYLLPRQQPFPDLTMLYYGGPDVASHRFWQYMRPKQFRYEVDANGIALFGDTISHFYERADQTLGEALALLPKDANVIVCSDHGFHAISTEVPSPIGITGHHEQGPPGVVVLAGPAFQVGLGAAPIVKGEGKILDLGWVYDIHPLALYLLGIPVGRTVEDPDAGPLLSAVQPALRKERPMEWIPSHDEGFRAPKKPRQASGEATEMYHVWMRSLGYATGTGSTDERVGPDKSPAGGVNKNTPDDR